MGKMKSGLFAFFIMTVFLCQGDEDLLYLSDVTIINPVAEKPLSGMTLVISDDKILRIDKAEKITIPDNARIISGKNKYVIPGLWDMHVHLSYWGNFLEVLSLLIANGVTGVRDMGGDLKQIDQWRLKILKGKQIGPHIIRAGLVIDGPKPDVKYRYTIQNKTEAQHAVSHLKQMGVDFIKIHNKVPPDAFFALARQAEIENIPFVGHIPFGVSAREASIAGMSSIEHTEVLPEASLYQNEEGKASSIDEAMDFNRGKRGAQLFKLFSQNNTWYVPTLVEYQAQVLAPENRKSRKGRERLLNQFVGIVKEMHEAGVHIMAGTDFFSRDYGIFPGTSLHDELIFFVAAGFTPMEAIGAATIQPAIFMGNEDILGSIEEGKFADLVLLDENPLENIKNLKKIRAVISRGRLTAFQKIQEIKSKGSLSGGN